MKQLGLDDSFLWNIIELIQDGVYVSEDRRFILVNPAFAAMLEYEPDELLGRDVMDVLAEPTRDEAMSRYNARMAGEDPPRLHEVLAITRTGKIINVRLNATTLRMPTGRVFHIGSAVNVTEEKAMMRNLWRSQRELSRIIDNLPDVFYRTDSQGRIEMASAALVNLLGYEPHEVIGKPLAAYYVNAADREPTALHIKAYEGRPVEVQTALRHRDGSIVWVSTHSYARFDDEGNYCGVEGTARNVTERRAMEQKLRDIAIRDPLTHVLNRFGFMDYLEHAFERASSRGERLALMYFDLNDFKCVNDTHGHDVGDGLLRAFCQRLRISFREGDSIGRLGGDEFVVLIEGNPDDDQLQRLQQRLGEELRAGYAHGNLLIPFSASVGVAVYPRDGVTGSDLLKAADMAMYSHKRSRVARGASRS